MAILQNVRVTISRTANLGNYNSAKVEVAVDVGRDREDDTVESLRETALDQAAALLKEAYEDFIPKKARETKE